jgi:hypothetical protein
MIRSFSLGVAIALGLLACKDSAVPSDTAARTCGGIADKPCDAGSYCKLPMGSCGGADIQGTCESIPQVCTDDFTPVCGCDHKTYSNACRAAMAQVSIDHAGEC